jgi:hypothetical protein
VRACCVCMCAALRAARCARAALCGGAVWGRAGRAAAAGGGGGAAVWRVVRDEPLCARARARARLRCAFGVRPLRRCSAQPQCAACRHARVVNCAWVSRARRWPAGVRGAAGRRARRPAFAFLLSRVLFCVCGGKGFSVPGQTPSARLPSLPAAPFPAPRRRPRGGRPWRRMARAARAAARRWRRCSSRRCAPFPASARPPPSQARRRTRARAAAPPRTR